MTGLAPGAQEVIRRRARAVREALDLEAGHPGATVRAVQRRDGTDGLAATVDSQAVSGSAAEVREWLESQAPVR